MLDESLSSSPSFWALLTSWFTPTVFFVVLNITIATIAITSSLTNQKHHRSEDSHTDTHPQPLARSPSFLQRFKSINFNNCGSHEPTHHDPPEYVFGHTQETEYPQITRSPSILQRLKSINLYNYFPTEPISAKIAAAAADTNLLQTTKHESENHHLDEPVLESDEEEEQNEEENDVVGQMWQEEPERSLDEIYSQLQGNHVNRTKSDTKPASGEVPVKLPKKMKKSASTKSAFAHFKEDDIVENRRPATRREAKVTAADDEVDAKADDFINKFKQQLKLQRLDSIMRYKDMISRGSAK